MQEWRGWNCGEGQAGRNSRTTKPCDAAPGWPLGCAERCEAQFALCKWGCVQRQRHACHPGNLKSVGTRQHTRTRVTFLTRALAASLLTLASLTRRRHPHLHQPEGALHHPGLLQPPVRRPDQVSLATHCTEPRCCFSTSIGGGQCCILVAAGSRCAGVHTQATVTASLRHSLFKDCAGKRATQPGTVMAFRAENQTCCADSFLRTNDKPGQVHDT